MKLVLKIFEGYGVETNLGDPLVFRVSLMNPEGFEDYQRNRTINEEIKELDTRLESEEITQEEYEQMKASLEEKKTPQDYMVVGSEKQPWSHQIEFTPEWLKPKLLSYEPLENSITLSPSLVAYALFGLTPEETRVLPTGGHKVKATLGELESNEVAAIITGEEKMPSMDEYADKARYLLMVGATAASAQLINGLLAGQPMNIEGLILKGDYHAALEQRDEAIAAYQLAIDAYNATGPREDDPPRVIIHKLNRLLVSRIDEDTA